MDDDCKKARKQWHDLRKMFIDSECKSSAIARNLMLVEAQLSRRYWLRLTPTERYELDSRKFFAQFPLSETAMIPATKAQEDLVAEKLVAIVIQIIPLIVKRQTEVPQEPTASSEVQ